jgi:protein O-mannosyl-transferase
MKREIPEWFYPGILVLLVLILNLNTFRNGFIPDDKAFLTAIPDISHIAWTAERIESGHSLLADVSLVVNRALTGDSPTGFRSANVLFHGAAVLLFFELTTILLGSRMLGLAAALVFVVHPVHVETIQRIQDRGILLAAVAIFGALVLTAGTESRRTAAAIWALYAAALGSSPSSLVFPLLYFGMIVFRGVQAGESPRNAVQPLLRNSGLYGLLILSGLYPFLAHPFSFPGSPSFVENPAAYQTLGPRLLTCLELMGKSLLLLVFPFRLSAEYSFNTFPVIASLRSPEWLAAAAITGLFAAALLVWRKRPAYLVSFFFFLVTLLPFCSLFLPARSIFSEGFLYLPSAGICWTFAQLCHDLGWIPESSHSDSMPFLRRFKALAIVALCLLVPWAAKTYVRNQDWSDEWTLYRAAVRVTPQSARARLLLGNSYFARGDYLGAERQFFQAVQIYPDYAEAAIRLAATYEALERYPRALELLSGFADRSGRFDAERLREMGRACLGMGNYAGAESYYRQSLEKNDNDPVTHREIGLLYTQFLNQPEEGRIHLERSRALRSQNP